MYANHMYYTLKNLLWFHSCNNSCVLKRSKEYCAQHPISTNLVEKVYTTLDLRKVPLPRPAFFKRVVALAVIFNVNTFCFFTFLDR